MLCLPDRRHRAVAGGILEIIIETYSIVGMDDTVVNTVQFRFAASSPRPSWTEIATFLKRLDVDLRTMETAYKTSNDRSLFVKFTSRDAMIAALQKNVEPKMFEYVSGASVEVRMTMAGRNVHYVRIFDLPPESSDECLSLVLKDYGTVEWMIREKFPANLGLDHVYTGVRGVYVDIDKEIPPTINVGNRKGRVFYDGLKDVCFLCHGVGHRKSCCPQRTNRSKTGGNKEGKQPVTYATVVSGQEAVSVAQESAEVAEEVIEVLEDDVLETSTEIVSEGEELQLAAREASTETEKEVRRKEAMEKLTEVAKAFGEALNKHNASQRRAQFASTGSGQKSGSKEHSRPKKLCARRTNY